MTKEEKAVYSRKFYEKHKEEILIYQKKHYEENKEEKSFYQKKFYKENKEEVLIYQKKYNEEHKEKRAVYRKKYNEEHKEKRAVTDKKYNEENKETRTVYRREYYKQKREIDPAFRIRCNLGTRLHQAVKGTNKSAHTMDLAGCSIEELMKHLESKFTEGMSFENYGEWHIDHIRPCASFNLINEEEQRSCFHYSNLQPLWAEDNLKKSDKWDGLTKN